MFNNKIHTCSLHNYTGTKGCPYCELLAKTGKELDMRFDLSLENMNMLINKINELEKENKKLYCNKTAIERIRAGEDVKQVLDDYGWKIKEK